MKTENNTTDDFAGTFAGKTAFCSAVNGVTNLYLTTVKISDGQHGWLYIPGMNAQTVTDTEKFIIYLYSDGYYRIQSGDLRWLSLNTEGWFLQYDELANAAAFAIQGNPFGSRLAVKTSSGDAPLFYTLQNNPKTPNVLGLTGGTDHYDAFAPTPVTPSLAVIRQQKQAVNADFGNVVLTGQDLSQGIDFSSAKFVGAQLAGVDFSNAKLDSANMSQTDLRGLNWGAPASASLINLSGSNAENCVFGGQTKALNCFKAIFSSANLSGANLINLNLEQANLSGAILNGAFLDKALLPNANLNGVVALKTSFAGAVLTDSRAQNAIFSRAVFDNAVLTRVRMGASSFLFNVSAQFAADLDQYKFPQPTLITAFAGNGVTLEPSAAVEILIKGQNWLIHDSAGPYKLILTDSGIQVFNYNPSLIPAILRGASLMGVTAATASLAGADLRGVRWYGASSTLNHADLQDAVFSGALLVSNDFTQANVSGVDFSDSILIQGNFTGCIAGPGGSRRAISFEGAHIEGTNFSKATFSGAVLTDAVVALDWGVPLLFLPLDDRKYLNTSGLSNLKAAFLRAGFDLGDASAVSDTSLWSIDNSQSQDPHAPKQYKVQKTASGFNVFGNGKFLFTLSASAIAFLNQPKASQQLVSLFANKNFSLALNAPIALQAGWTINVDPAAVYVRPYRFNKIQVQAETGRLGVYGMAPVLIENLPEYPQGIAFNATTNLLNALSPNAVGPAGVPFSWVGQKLMDAETFLTVFQD